LRTQDAGRWKGARWAGEKIPTLEEVLATIPDGKRLFVEIKCGREVLPELERVLAASGKKPEQVVLIGFDYETMRLARKQFPKLQVFWIVSYKESKQTGKFPELEGLAEKAQAAEFNGLDLDWHFPLDAAAVSRLKQRGLQLFVWTLDDGAVAARLAAAGVDGITTNRPRRLRESL
jgi:glycerophosphoryl diester phosphodiesterase